VSRQLFVNLPVRDLPRSMEFFRGLGFSFNERFTDETAACLVIGENNFAMLLTHEKFQIFTPLEIADATRVTEVLVAVSCENREEVDRVTETALGSGGSFAREPEDHGFMYGRSFRDPDGHIWEPFWMDPKFVPTSSPAD
jgi:uncharacterized protein